MTKYITFTVAAFIFLGIHGIADAAHDTICAGLSSVNHCQNAISAALNRCTQQQRDNGLSIGEAALACQPADAAARAHLASVGVPGPAQSPGSPAANPGSGSAGSPSGLPPQAPAVTTSFTPPQMLSNPLSNFTMQQLLQSILNIFQIVLVPIIVFFIIYAGFLYTTARGNAEQIKKAGRALIYAIIGGVIIVGAQVIATIVAATVTGFSSGP